MRKLRKRVLKSSIRMLRKSYGIKKFPESENIIVSDNRAIIRVVSDKKDKTFCVTPVLMNRKEKREIIFTSNIS